MSLSCWLLSLSPFSKEWGSSLGYRWVDSRFGLTCISFLDVLEIFPCFASLFVHCQGLLSLGCTSGEVIGSLYSGRGFFHSFYL